jgi:hypothetical protein
VGKRCEEDERFIEAIRSLVVSPKPRGCLVPVRPFLLGLDTSAAGSRPQSGQEHPLYIMDARPRRNAMANQAKVINPFGPCLQHAGQPPSPSAPLASVAHPWRMRGAGRGWATNPPPTTPTAL